MTTMTISGGLLDLDAMIAHARSDAEFDGRDWGAMTDEERGRYLARVEKGYEAAALATFTSQNRHRTAN